MFRHNSNELRGKGKTLQVSTKEAKYLKKGDIKPASVHPSELSFLLLGGTIVVESYNNYINNSCRVIERRS